MTNNFEIKIQDNTGKAAVDKIILTQALKMALLGVAMKTICELKVKDVYDQGEIVDEIDLGNGKVTKPLNQQFKTDLLDYIGYLQSIDHGDPNSPLFPHYDGESGKKNLARHIKRFTNFRDFHDVRKSAEKSFQEKQKEAGASYKESINAAASYFGKTVRGIKGSQSTGKRISSENTPKTITLLDQIIVLNTVDILLMDKVRTILGEYFTAIETEFTEPEERLNVKTIFIETLIERVIIVMKEYNRDLSLIEKFRNQIDNTQSVDDSWNILIAFIETMKEGLSKQEKKDLQVESGARDRIEKIQDEQSKKAEYKSKRAVREGATRKKHARDYQDQSIHNNLTSDNTPSMRVHRLAKELGIQNKLMLQYLEEAGIIGKSLLSKLDEIEVEIIREKIADRIETKQLNLKKILDKSRKRSKKYGSPIDPADIIDLLKD